MIGIHRIFIGRERSAYFVERPFGNYLIFADWVQKLDYEFIRSKGGLFRLFFESFDNISSAHQGLFNRYGCLASGFSSEASVNAYLPVERIGHEFDDPTLKFYRQGGSMTVTFSQRDQRVLILGADYYLDRRQRVYLQQNRVGEEFYTNLQMRGTTFLFFSFHERESFLSLKN